MEKSSKNLFLNVFFGKDFNTVFDDKFLCQKCTCSLSAFSAALKAAILSK